MNLLPQSNWVLAWLMRQSKRDWLVRRLLWLNQLKGNTGIALAMASALPKGIWLILTTIPNTMSNEQCCGFMSQTRTYARNWRHRRCNSDANWHNPQCYILTQQFRNPANIWIHRETTAEEIWFRYRWASRYDCGWDPALLAQLLVWQR